MCRLEYLCTLFNRTKRIDTKPDAVAFLENDSHEPVCGELRNEDIVETIRNERPQPVATDEQAALLPGVESSTSAQPEARISCGSACEALSVLGSFFRQRKANDSTLQYLSALEEDYTRLALTELHQQLLNPYILAFDPPPPPPEAASLVSPPAPP
jgi:hypothetical protein